MALCPRGHGGFPTYLFCTEAEIRASLNELTLGFWRHLGRYPDYPESV